MGFKENLKSEINYSGLLIKELAAKSGVNKHSIDNYLNKRGQVPSAEVAVRIAQVLGVTVEYLVTGKDSKHKEKKPISAQAQVIAVIFDQLSVEKQSSVMDYIKWLKHK